VSSVPLRLLPKVSKQRMEIMQNAYAAGERSEVYVNNVHSLVSIYIKQYVCRLTIFKELVVICFQNHSHNALCGGNADSLC
jgi:hypothetical protein